ncbi:MAG: phosphoribosyltransferase family protein [Bacteroidetes bacterium]|jgi:Pyrimidine operon attenuation protein/uracil phosphoribosyltransferase|nr:phosphoribosyltransferase family protein [Bacteroidota bacterium]
MKEEILNHDQITHILRRMAFQILESNANETHITIAGIDGSGYILAQKIAAELTKVSDLKLKVIKVSLDKKAPTAEKITLDSEDRLSGESVLLVDDVLNSGATLMYGCLPFLKQGVRKLKTAVLVNRNHKRYPVKADFKGISLSTSTQTHVEVSLEENAYSAYLE